MTNYNDLTKEQLIADLQSAKAENEFLRQNFDYLLTVGDHARAAVQLSPHELSARLAIAEARLAVFEEDKAREKKKQEFERKLVEATDFLNVNGYKVEKMTMGEMIASISYAAIKAAEPKKRWKNKDVIAHLNDLEKHEL